MRFKLPISGAPARAAKPSKHGWHSLGYAVPIVVALMASFAISTLSSTADQRRVSQLQLARINSAANAQRAVQAGVLEIAVVAEGRNPTLDSELEELPGHIRGLRTRLETDMGALRRTSPDDGAVEAVRVSLNRLQQQLDTQLQLLRERDFVQAYLFDRERLDPAFAELNEAIDRADARYSERAVRARLFAGLGTVFIVLLTTLAMGLVHLERRRREREQQRVVKESEARFRSLVQNSSDLIMIAEQDMSLRYVSPATNRLLGYPASELEGRGLRDLLHGDDRETLGSIVTRLLEGPDLVSSLECGFLHRSGVYRDVEMTLSNLLDDPSVGGVVVNARDITERKKAERERAMLQKDLEHQAFHDSLTGLANRALFKDRVDHALIRAARSERELAVLFIDLDDFKLINDSLGHDIGDALLMAVGRRLESCLRAADTVARLGGDEFAVLVEDVESRAEVRAVGERLIDAMRSPFDVRGRQVLVSGSVGMAFADGIDVSSDDLLGDADVAMYSAKATAKGTLRSFEKELRSSLLHRMSLEADLQKAVERSQLELHYQPIVDLITGRVAAVEALVRWNHPERGMVAPGEFIPLAEETGLILPIGEWVLREACLQAMLWEATGRLDPDVKVSVNLSVRQFHQKDLVEQVARILRECRVEPSRVILEITESVLARDLEAVEKIHSLKELGVQLAVDDFGTGYSSLSYLRKFPIDILKIDKSFVDGLGRGPDESALARAIIQIGDNLGLKSVAEGIESHDQLRELRELGCTEAQGFLLSRPVPASELHSLMENGFCEAPSIA